MKDIQNQIPTISKPELYADILILELNNQKSEGTETSEEEKNKQLSYIFHVMDGINTNVEYPSEIKRPSFNTIKDIYVKKAQSTSDNTGNKRIDLANAILEDLKADESKLKEVSDTILSDWKAHEKVSVVAEDGSTTITSNFRLAQSGAKVEGIASFYENSAKNNTSIHIGRENFINIDDKFYTSNTLNDSSTPKQIKEKLENAHLETLFEAAIQSKIFSAEETTKLTQLSKDKKFFVSKLGKDETEEKELIGRIVNLVEFLKSFGGTRVVLASDENQHPLLKSAIAKKLTTSTGQIKLHRNDGGQENDDAVFNRLVAFEDAYRDKMKEQGLYSGRRRGFANEVEVTTEVGEKETTEIRTYTVVDKDGFIPVDPFNPGRGRLCSYDEMVSGKKADSSDDVSHETIIEARKRYYEAAKQIGQDSSYFPDELLEKMKMLPQKFKKNEEAQIDESEPEVKKLVNYGAFKRKESFILDESEKSNLLTLLRGILVEQDAVTDEVTDAHGSAANSTNTSPFSSPRSNIFSTRTGPGGGGVDERPRAADAAIGQGVHLRPAGSRHGAVGAAVVREEMDKGQIPRRPSDAGRPGGGDGEGGFEEVKGQDQFLTPRTSDAGGSRRGSFSSAADDQGGGDEAGGAFPKPNEAADLTGGLLGTIAGGLRERLGALAGGGGAGEEGSPRRGSNASVADDQGGRDGEGGSRRRGSDGRDAGSPGGRDGAVEEPRHGSDASVADGPGGRGEGESPRSLTISPDMKAITAPSREEPNAERRRIGGDGEGFSVHRRPSSDSDPEVSSRLDFPPSSSAGIPGGGRRGSKQSAAGGHEGMGGGVAGGSRSLSLARMDEKGRTPEDIAAGENSPRAANQTDKKIGDRYVRSFPKGLRGAAKSVGRALGMVSKKEASTEGSPTKSPSNTKARGGFLSSLYSSRSGGKGSGGKGSGGGRSSD